MSLSSKLSVLFVTLLCFGWIDATDPKVQRYFTKFDIIISDYKHAEQEYLSLIQSSSMSLKGKKQIKDEITKVQEAMSSNTAHYNTLKTNHDSMSSSDVIQEVTSLMRKAHKYSEAVRDAVNKLKEADRATTTRSVWTYTRGYKKPNDQFTWDMVKDVLDMYESKKQQLQSESPNSGYKENSYTIRSLKSIQRYIENGKGKTVSSIDSFRIKFYRRRLLQYIASIDKLLVKARRESLEREDRDFWKNHPNYSQGEKLRAVGSQLHSLTVKILDNSFILTRRLKEEDNPSNNKIEAEKKMLEYKDTAESYCRKYHDLRADDKVDSNQVNKLSQDVKNLRENVSNVMSSW